MTVSIQIWSVALHGSTKRGDYMISSKVWLFAISPLNSDITVLTAFQAGA